jgi:hypothetical protein
MTGGIGLLPVLWDDVHHLQDVISRAQIPRDPLDRRHAKVL